jgi:hypothetical protein
MMAEIVVKGPERLGVFLELIDAYQDAGALIKIKVNGGDGAAFISRDKFKVKILTANWENGDPEDFPDKNILL